ncbi:MAG TPA: putative ABC exporter domain-containing protein [Gemmatimonadaceae bacterium]|nr:putative ABC exporter domain-containing protein [Gemmatimonadaceae bacterium]
MNAFLYLSVTSARNRIVGMVRRARRPRYAAALIVGGLYVWGFLVRPLSHGTAEATSFFLGQPTEMIVTLLIVVTLMGSWVFGSDATALAFTQAEVSMLFSAPVTRRQLIKYKLFRAQFAVVINALIWVFVLRRGGTALPSPLRAISLWVLFSTLNFHRLGAALVRSSWREHGAAGARRHRASIVAFVAVGVAIAAGMIGARDELWTGEGIGPFFTALGRVLADPPAYWGLFPFHLVVAPTFAKSVGEWSYAILPALGVMLVHAFWVLRTDAAFEDAAIKASAERARRLDARSRRALAVPAAPASATSTIKLAAVGHPALAIVWKNILCLRRTSQWRVFIGPAVMAIALGTAMGSGETDLAARIASGSMAFAGMLLLFGGRLIRNDLRHDMQHLPLLKTLPIAPEQIVMAEIASSALPMALVQIGLIIVAYFAMLASTAQILPAEVRLALFVAAPFAVLSLNAALATIQNGTAVLFPGWVRLGPTVSTGVEALGQNVLATISNFFSLAIALVIPLGVGWIVVAWMQRSQPVSLALVIIAAAAILGIETYAVIRILGRALARAEPSQTE